MGQHAREQARQGPKAVSPTEEEEEDGLCPRWREHQRQEPRSRPAGHLIWSRRGECAGLFKFKDSFVISTNVRPSHIIEVCL